MSKTAQCDTRTREVSWPVLLWELGASASRAGGAKPRVTDPIVLELRPRLGATASEVTLGRGAECDIVLAEPSVSRLHARFRREPHTGLWSVTDLESERGTYQDGVLILPGRPALLLCRSRLTLGNVELLFLQTYAAEQSVRASWTPSPVRLTRRR
ncbi:FHA domain-containing protein [Myxococcus hansupus]|uniref:FHA domain-containing protein n=1 Tax=Pseudomyxococcus hansupus TaxID=1297742 RepID=UPI000B17F41C|nr:FHA domain-containing protein [Myxococcus hansupus]